VDTRHLRQDPERHRLFQPLGHCGRQGASANLDHDMVETPLARQGCRHLVSEGLAAFYGQPVLVALTREGQCSVRYCLLQAVVGRVARNAGDTRARGDLRT
jgi:hypothetical protein